MIILEDAYGTPLAREDQFRKSVAVQVAPDSRANHPHVAQDFAVGFIEAEATSASPVDLRIHRLGILPGPNSATDEQIQIAIAIYVGHSQGTHARITPY